MSHNGMQQEKKVKTKPYTYPPIVGIRIKRTTAEVVRSSVEAAGGGKRGHITEISRAAIKNAVEILTNSDPELNSMIVLTYPETFPDDGRIVKAHHKRLLQAIERKFGDFSYFTAFEFQRRGAPHFHIGISFDLRNMGEVEKLRRKTYSRRKPAFETVKPVQDWLFETWVEIISKPDIVHYGEVLDWAGLDDEDIASMEDAYYGCNAGISWEVMREKRGATKYFVKELSGLKDYQKKIPEDYKNPGRAFLYSQDMKFNEADALEFVVTDAEIRELLDRFGWQWTPARGKPLFKRLWNAAAGLVIQLIEAGYTPIRGSLAGLRQFWDLRMLEFVDKHDPAFYMAAIKRVLDWANLSVDHWERIKRKFVYDDRWEFIFSTGPP